MSRCQNIKYLNANVRLPNVSGALLQNPSRLSAFLSEEKDKNKTPPKKKITLKRISSAKTRARYTRMTPHESPASIADSAERIGKKTYKEKKGGVWGVGVGTSSQSMTDLSAR